MKFSVITLFPDLITQAAQVGVVGQALNQNKIQLDVFTPRLWTTDIHKTVDDRPFGGGDGMVLMPEPLSQCLDEVLASNNQVSSSVAPRCIYLSPQGKTLSHSLVMELAQEKHLLLLCGRYAGVDQRLLQHYSFEEVSIGDYVLSGGELAALVVIDAVGRQLAGVLGHEKSSSQDSFAGEGLLEAPCFTRPREWKGYEVPEFLLSGHHTQIEEDRWFLGVIITYLKRPDLFAKYIQNHIHSPNAIKSKVWKRALERLQNQSSNALTSLGLNRKSLDEFEGELRRLGILDSRRG